MNALKIKSFLSMLAIVCVLASVTLQVKAADYEGWIVLTGSPVTWIAKLHFEGAPVKVKVIVPQRLYELIVNFTGKDEFEDITGPFSLTLGEQELYVGMTMPVDKLEFERVKVGDVDADDDVDILDLAAIARALTANITSPYGMGWNQYNPYTDFNLDGKINVYDLMEAGKNYGQEWYGE